MKFRILLASLLSVFLVNCAHTDKSEFSTANVLFSKYWAEWMSLHPIWATYVGIHKHNHRMPEVSENAIQKKRMVLDKYITSAKTLMKSSYLSDQDQVNLKLFIANLENRLTEINFELYYMPLSPRGGFHTEIVELYEIMPFVTEQDYKNYISRLSGFGKFTDQYIYMMRQGVKKGIVPPKVVFKNYDKTFTDLFVTKSEEHLLYKPFVKMSDKLTQDQKEDLRKQARAVIKDVFDSSLRKLYSFWKKEYSNKLRTTTAISDLPRGKKYYEFLVGKFTTLKRTPQQIHDLGLSEVARIKAEMIQVMKSTKFKGNFKQFVSYLRTNPKFYVKSKDQLMKEVAFVLKKMDGKLPELFKTLPRMPYGIKQIPDFMAPKQTTAYYWPPAGDGKRAGYYYVNTYKLNSRPLYEVEALSLHEAVPGHHLQIALQQEMDNVPEFRKHLHFTAFVEGWGLYAESLGKEVGFYEDPYSDFGRLTYEMWRACRLVVDTGLHYFGWSRDKAIKFMTENTSLSEHNIVAEVDRYLTIPGQALAYKMGQLKILELRERSKKVLGQKFDIREFHDTVLSGGAIPLNVLEEKIDKYIKSKKL